MDEDDENDDYAAEDLAELIGLNYGRQVFFTRGKHTTKSVLTTGNPATKGVTSHWNWGT